MQRRKPQPRCKCGHAKTKHAHRNMVWRGVDYSDSCGYCWDKCLKFEMDNLATLERLNAFQEQKEEETQKNISL